MRKVLKFCCKNQKWRKNLNFERRKGKVSASWSRLVLYPRLWFLLSRSSGEWTGKRQRERNEESEWYLHAICILVDPYCFHLQQSGENRPEPNLSITLLFPLSGPRFSHFLLSASNSYTSYIVEHRFNNLLIHTITKGDGIQKAHG